jgi:DNA-binding MarR family transcriptional regulator
MSSIPADPDQLRTWRDATLYRMTLRASRAERSTTLQALHARGYTDVTLTDTTLLANLDEAGATITDLARRSGITRQAASQQIRALQGAGYVRSRVHPDDPRASLVRRTAKGRRLLEDALAIVARLESDYEKLIGTRQMAALKKSLQALLDHIDPGGSLG